MERRNAKREREQDEGDANKDSGFFKARRNARVGNGKASHQVAGKGKDGQHGSFLIRRCPMCIAQSVPGDKDKSHMVDGTEAPPRGRTVTASSVWTGVTGVVTPMGFRAVDCWNPCLPLSPSVHFLTYEYISMYVPT
jgi:hypothetical protein